MAEARGPWWLGCVVACVWLVSWAAFPLPTSPALAQATPAGSTAELSCRETSALPLEPVDDHGRSLWRLGGRTATVRDAAPDAVEFAFPTDARTAIFYRLVDAEPAGPFALELELRVDGFEEISSLRFGWLGEERFWSDRLRHVRQGRTYSLRLVPGSVAFALANDWRDSESWTPGAIRVVIEGTPGPEARLRFGTARLRHLPPPSAEVTLFGDCAVRTASLVDWLRQWVERAGDSETFYERWTKLGMLRPKDSVERAEAFRKRGEIHLKYLPPLAAGAPGETPEGVAGSTTARFRWQALDLVEMLVIAYRETGKVVYLELARDQARDWIEREGEGPPTDRHYTWYDHGVAERQVNLLMLLEALVERGGDRTFAVELLDLVHRQAQLLASPSFYARNQPTGYHNHAMLQDLALLATVEALPGWPGEDAWRTLAVERLLDQLDALIVADEGASVENSASYQMDLAKVCRSVADLLDEFEIGEAATVSSSRCDAMDRFFSEISYPDGTWPAYGDTGRFPNSRREPGGARPVELLARLYPESGYAVLRHPGGSALGAWQLDVFAPDLTTTHKHADDLSFTFWMDGTEWLIDPGFFAYGDSPHARYGRTAPAHNAVVVGGRDYSPGVDQADLRWAEGTPGRTLVGRHRGYHPVVVERRFTPSGDGASILIEDDLVGGPASGVPGTEVWFHAGDGIEVELDGAGVASLVRKSDGRRMKVAPGWAARCRTYNGHEGALLAGWYYPAFGEKAPTNSWVCQAPGASWTTTLRLDPDGAVD